MKQRCQSFWFRGSLFLFWLATTSPMQAQIAPDTTLPNSSIVTPNGNTRVITGGTQAETNLFHSFSEFSVPAGSSASFQQIDQGIENVISRVTGSSVSSINGLIEVLQANGTVSSADFFLINPNGIIFGANATLNIGGSFVASTASSLNFADGTQFSATAHPTTPLLTVSVPVGLQFGSPAASIQVQGAALIVPTGNTLGLVGGDLTLIGGGLGAAGGRIELGSVAGSATPELAPVQISLTPVVEGWALSYEGIQNFQNIESQQATVTASGNGGGDIQVQGGRVTLTAGSQMLANTQGTDPGGTLAVSASESVEISGRSTDGRDLPSGLFARVNSGATGSGGNLTIETRQLEVQDRAEVSTSTSGSGKGGNLTVQATESVSLSGTSSLRATVQQGATGDGGNLTIETGRLLVQDGAQILNSTFGQGKAGNLTLQNATEVELVGGVVADGRFIPSGLFNQTTAEATGDGGNLLISAGKLTLQEGAQVNSTTFGVGRAGDLTVRATEVKLVGAALSADGELFTNQNLPFPSGLFSGTDIGSRGDGGTLTVETDRLSLQDGAVVQTTTVGEGNAGNLIIQASESVELIGTAKGNPFPTSLLAVSGGIPGFPGIIAATGKGGDLTIATGELIVQDGAVVAVSSLNPTSDAKGAGNIDVTAQIIRLDNRASITAATASGDGGSINLQDSDLLLLRDNSNISTEAGSAQAGGNGGNIDINAGFVVALPQENSDIIANAFEGNGGNIEIRAQSIFGLSRNDELEPRLNTTSDITASSRFGSAGTVTINTPDVDPSRGLGNLPAELVDASNQIAAGCASDAEAIARNVFIITGRGGLPPSPTETLSGETVLTNWATIEPQFENRSSAGEATNATRETAPTTIVEAQGWAIAPNGQVILTASASTTPNSSSLIPTSCNGS